MHQHQHGEQPPHVQIIAPWQIKEEGKAEERAVRYGVAAHQQEMFN